MLQMQKNRYFPFFILDSLMKNIAQKLVLTQTFVTPTYVLIIFFTFQFLPNIYTNPSINFFFQIFGPGVKATIRNPWDRQNWLFADCKYGWTIRPQYSPAATNVADALLYFGRVWINMFGTAFCSEIGSRSDFLL